MVKKEFQECPNINEIKMEDTNDEKLLEEFISINAKLINLFDTNKN